MAPTDFQTSHPTVRGTALGVLLPMCDSDVVRLSGLGFYDRSVLPGKDTAGNFKSVLEVWRTNHNGYNTQWQTDDTYQAASHTCPGQGTPLFKFQVGLSAQQQAIGRYFLMGLARAKSQNAAFGQLFNPAYTLPAGLRSLTRIDRGYFVGTSAAARLLVRFNGTCGQKLLVTTKVAGTCLSPSNSNGAPAEHDVTTSAARVRWNRTGQTTNFTLFVLNNGTAVSLGGFKTLDMRVGVRLLPGDIAEISRAASTSRRRAAARTGATSASTCRTSGNHLSLGVAPATYLAAPQTIAVSVPPDAQRPYRSRAIPSRTRSCRASASRYLHSRRADSALASVKYVRVALGSATSRGGLYFGDAWAVGAAFNALAMEPESAVADLGKGDTSMILAQATGFPSPAGLPFVPATGELRGGYDDRRSGGRNRQRPPRPRRHRPATALSRSGVEACRRSRLVSHRNRPMLQPTSALDTVEFTLATLQPLTDTSDSGFQCRDRRDRGAGALFRDRARGRNAEHHQACGACFRRGCSAERRVDRGDERQRYLGFRRTEQGCHPLAGACRLKGAADPMPPAPGELDLKSAGFTVNCRARRRGIAQLVERRSPKP